MELDSKVLEKIHEYSSKIQTIKQKAKSDKLERLNENRFKMQEEKEKIATNKILEKLRQENIKRREIDRNSDARTRWLSLREKNMNIDNEVFIKSFQELTQMCHDNRSEPIRPIESQVEGAQSEIPMFLPAVEDPSLKPLLLAWYYAGYYTGRYQMMQEMSKK